MSTAYTSAALVALVGSVLSWTAEIWFIVCMRIRKKKNSPLERMLQLFCVLHALVAVFNVVGARLNICEVMWLGTQFWATAGWFVSFFIALSIMLAVYTNVTKKQMEKTQYLFYLLIFLLPAIICTILTAASIVTFDTSASGRSCIIVDPSVAEAITMPGLFFLILFLNIIMLVMIIYKIQQMRALPSENKKKKKKHRKWIFYCVVFMAMGFWKLPSIIYFIYRAYGRVAPEWTTILTLVFLPSEGFVLSILFGWYFSLFRLCADKLGFKRNTKSSTNEIATELN